MKAISEEKNKQNIRRQEMQREEDQLDSERRKLEIEQAKMTEKEVELIKAAETLKERSEEVDQMYFVSLLSLPADSLGIRVKHRLSCRNNCKAQADPVGITIKHRLTLRDKCNSRTPADQ